MISSLGRAQLIIAHCDRVTNRYGRDGHIRWLATDIAETLRGLIAAVLAAESLALSHAADTADPDAWRAPAGPKQRFSDGPSDWTLARRPVAQRGGGQ